MLLDFQNAVFHVYMRIKMKMQNVYQQQQSVQL